MNFRVIFGVILILFAAYLSFGTPEKAVWPAMMGKQVHRGWMFVAESKPYSNIISFALGIALVMTARKF